jgi:NodT family efflux transporter outer membrane factor (OMF) lipoprotein
MTRPAGIRALAALALALAGCVVGPRYTPPTPPAGAAAPLVSVDPTAETTAEAPDAWWRLYEDPRFDGYMRQAFLANTDLRVAEANLAAARALLDASRAGLYPSTELRSESIYGRDPVTNEILEINGRKPKTIWFFEDVLDVSYELDLFGRVHNTIAAERADADGAEASRDAVRITVAAETARAYAQICTLGEQIDVAQQSLAVVSNEADISLRRQQAGAGSEFDVVRAQALVAQARAAIPALEGQRRSALFQLAALLGRTPTRAPTEALACRTPPRLKSLIPVGDGAALLRRRPDVRLADRRIAAATARVGVATADLYPRIMLTGFYGGAASDIGELVHGPGLVWGVGPKISWNFPNQIGARARLRQAKAVDVAAIAGFDSTVLTALKETEQALASYSAALQQRASLAEAQVKARRAYEIAHNQYLAGSSTELDLLTAEQTLVSADAALAATDTALSQDQIGLFKALGGGWRSVEPASPVTAAAASKPAPVAP